MRCNQNLIVPLKYLELGPLQKGMLGIYQGLLEDTYEILDVGCGHKILTRYFNCKKLIGIDICEDYLNKHDVHGDIRNLSKFFKPNSFDCVLCLDVIEHLTNTEGIKLLEDIEKIARKKVIVFTPTNWDDNSEATQKEDLWSFGNKYNLHRSLWSEKDFITLGYTRLETVYDKDYIIVVKTTG